MQSVTWYQKSLSSEKKLSCIFGNIFEFCRHHYQATGEIAEDVWPIIYTNYVILDFEVVEIPYYFIVKFIQKARSIKQWHDKWVYTES